MGLRTDLHELLVATIGSRNVYFQPPEDFKMNYPCIVYDLDRIDTIYANNKPWLHNVKYSVTVIDRNPDSQIPMKIADLPMSHHDRHFVSDNLHHDVFTLYY